MCNQLIRTEPGFSDTAHAGEEAVFFPFFNITKFYDASGFVFTGSDVDEESGDECPEWLN